MDQSAVAGVGNLLADEMLFRAGIDPRTPTGLLSPEQRAALYKNFTQTMRTLQRRGGSHMGDHMEGRYPRGVLSARRRTDALGDDRWTYDVLVLEAPDLVS